MQKPANYSAAVWLYRNTLCRNFREIKWRENGSVDELQHALLRPHIPIVFLRTGELPYWDEDTPHAVVVVGIEPDVVFVNDPAFENAPIPIPKGDFELAWDEFGCQWAAIFKSK